MPRDFRSSTVHFSMWASRSVTFCSLLMTLAQPACSSVKTPLFTAAQLGDAGVRLALYPLSAFRAMSRAAQRVYETIRAEGTQAGTIDAMQTRDELYDVLNYREHERRLDGLRGGA